MRTIWHIQRYPIIMFMVIAAALLISLMGFHRLNLDVDFSDYFAPSDPRFVAFNSMMEKFERHDQLWLLLETQQDWRDKEPQAQLINFIDKLKASQDIVSIQGYNQFVQGTAKEDKILNYKAHPRLASVLSANGQGLLLQLRLSNHRVQDFKTQSLWLDDVLQRMDSDSSEYWQPLGVNTYFNGTHALNWQYARVLSHDLSWFAPALLGIILLMAVLFIRQKLWVLALCINCGITLVLSMGLAAWLKLTLTAITAFVPVIIVTLGLAYASHLYFGWRGEINRGQTNEQALRHAVKINQAPLFYSSITTIFGFSLLMFSPSPPIQSFGLLVAFAVLCNYLLTLTILLFFARHSKPSMTKGLDFSGVVAIAKWNAGQPMAVMTGIVLISAFALVSVSKLTLNDDPLSYFESSNPFSLSSEKMTQYFSGINLQHYVVSSAANEQLAKAEISFIYKFSRFLKRQPQVVKVQHIGDWIKSAGVGQNQFKQILANNSVTDLGLAGELSADKQSSLVTLYLQPMTAMELIAFEHKVGDWLAEHSTKVMVSAPIASNLMFAHLSVENANNMLLSFAVALIVLAILLCVLKRSIIFGVMGLLLNFLPLLWVFALWQLNGGFISLGTAVVLGMMLGIIVDDTLHLMLKLPDSKVLSERAIWLSLYKVLPVISFTTLTIALGFSIGLLSAFAPIVHLSLLSCLVVIFAWGFDVLMLPVLYRRWISSRLYKEGNSS
ncbi:exporter of the RND superfamily protein-like protein [Shewanella pealeana ATCC 700345]|uniref:Exporter of the RND superfamily protein-like protein n=1 Tax=Shewanella pealeana (strain ATCC 700345 / ANG-SQ1) TaxID=398579 RepID=A8H7E7_SHEPA|nr:exporter of the RND superfamily protein-like protein [Shewanella pealeana ATCC 700345]